MQDKRVDLWLDAPLYLALKARSNGLERSVSQHLRFLVKRDLEQSLADEADADIRMNAGNERETAEPCRSVARQHAEI